VLGGGKLAQGLDRAPVWRALRGGVTTKLARVAADSVACHLHPRCAHCEALIGGPWAQETSRGSTAERNIRSGVARQP